LNNVKEELSKIINSPQAGKADQAKEASAAVKLLGSRKVSHFPFDSLRKIPSWFLS